MSIPNILTLFRLASAPVFLALFIGTGRDGFLLPVLDAHAGLWACLIVLSLSEISDVLDGILARRLNQVSNFGKLLDPYADSIFRLSCYFGMASHAHGKWIPLWMVMILLYRDLLVTVIRTFAVERGVYVHARSSGKIKAITQGTVVFVTLVVALWYGEDYVAFQVENPAAVASSLAHYLMWVVTAVTAWSGVDYFWANRHLFALAEARGVLLGGREIRGEYSRRPYDPDRIGIPIEKRSLDGVEITVAGIELVKSHLNRFQADQANAAMVERLQGIVAGALAVTIYDLNFYTHELRERERYCALGYECGVPASRHEAHALWNNAHTATLEEYGIADERKELYHPNAYGIILAQDSGL